MKEINTNQEPYGVIDRHTGAVIYRTTRKHRTRARRFADRKDDEYGAYRYLARNLTPAEAAAR